MKFTSILKVCLLGVFFLSLISCNNEKASSDEMDEKNETMNADYKISLAQWSLHKSYFGDFGNDFEWFGRMLMTTPDSLLRGELDPTDFPKTAKEMGFDVIELVNTFYFSKSEDMEYWEAFKANCDEADVEVGLIMCDALGDLGNADEEARNDAVKNHHNWVNIAEYLGAKSIRVNAAGQGTAEEVAANAVDGLKKLGEYGASKGVNIIVENDGGYSSDGSWLAGVMKEVNMENVGTLPDFGNFCIKRSMDGCEDEYDKYKGMEEIMPYAKGVSAKSHEFDLDGNEVNTDFKRMMEIVKKSGFKGHVGIEYEGSQLSETDGIKATNKLLEKVIKEI